MYIRKTNVTVTNDINAALKMCFFFPSLIMLSFSRFSDKYILNFYFQVVLNLDILPK